MGKFGLVVAAAVSNINGDEQRRKDHRHSEPSPGTDPARIFEDPENDVGVLILACALKQVQFL